MRYFVFPASLAAAVAALTKRQVLVWLLQGLGFGLLAAFVFSQRGAPALADNLDIAWSYAAELASQQGWVYGRNFITNVGPLADLLYTAALGERLYALAWLSIALTLSYVASLFWLTRQQSGRALWLRWVLLLWGGVAVVRPPVMIDVQIPIITVAVALYWLELVGGNAPLAWRRLGVGLAGMLMLAVLAATKFTSMVMFGFVFCMVTLECLRGRRWLAACLIAPLALALLALVWRLCGQPVLAIVDYATWNLRLASSYATTTSIPVSNPWLLVCALTLAVTLVVLTLMQWAVSRGRAWPRAIVILGLGFIAWKHGFTQAENAHPLYFLVPSVLWVLYLMSEQNWRGFASLKLRAYALGACITLALLGRYFMPFAADELRTPWTYQMSDYFDFVGDQMRTTWRALREGPHANHSLLGRFDPIPLPKLEQIVGNGTVDVLGSRQVVAMLKLPRWRYQPRPVFQSMLALNEALMERNQEALLQQPPDFLLLRPSDGLLGHFGMADDQLAWDVALRHYDYVAEENGFVLLRKAAQELPPPRLLRTVEFDPQQGFNVDITPELQQQPLWVSLELERSWLGKLQGLLFQFSNPLLALQVHDPNQAQERANTNVEVYEHMFLMPPEVWRVPVLINPTSSRFSSIAWFWDRSLPHASLRRMQIQLKHPWAFTHGARLNFFTSP